MPVQNLNGTTIAYQVLGEGEPLVFLNGVMMTMQSWALQTSVFQTRFRCVLHDFRGQLLSEQPETPWTLEDHSDDLRALLDHLETESCHLIGTSYGGEVGMIFAYTYPERVRSLSLISCVSEVGGELDRVVTTWGDTALREPENLYGISLPSNFSPQFLATHPEIREQGEQRLRSCPPEFFTGFSRLIDAFRQLDITADLHRIGCPTLVLVGDEDALKPPRYSRMIAETIPNSELQIIPGAGHAVILEKPAEVNTALHGFLEKHL